MVNWPRAGAMGGVGFYRAFRSRYELTSRCIRATRTSATMRPPTGLSWRPRPTISASFRILEPQRRLAVPSRILEEDLQILVLDVELAQHLHHVADDGNTNLDAVVRVPTPRA